VRRSALEAAGRLCVRAITPALASATFDPEFLVRRMACVCAAQLATTADSGPSAAGVSNPALIEGLGNLLGEDDRYNRAFASVALRRIAPRDPTGQAGERLIHFLLTSRYDSDGVF
jgi:hypothetical protein